MTTDTVAGADITQRERDVLILRGKGFSAAEIAERLGISKHTVQEHASSAIVKLGVSNSYEAVVWAAKEGWL